MMNYLRSAKILTSRVSLRAPTQMATFAKLRFYSDSALSNTIIQDRILEVLKGYKKIDPTKISAEAQFSKDLKLDSLDTIEVVMAIEEEFSIEIPDHEANEIKSVDEAIKYISSRKDAN